MSTFVLWWAMEALACHSMLRSTRSWLRQRRRKFPRAWSPSLPMAAGSLCRGGVDGYNFGNHLFAARDQHLFAVFGLLNQLRKSGLCLMDSGNRHPSSLAKYSLAKSEDWSFFVIVITSAGVLARGICFFLNHSQADPSLRS